MTDVEKQEANVEQTGASEEVKEAAKKVEKQTEKRTKTQEKKMPTTSKKTTSKKTTSKKKATKKTAVKRKKGDLTKGDEEVLQVLLKMKAVSPQTAVDRTKVWDAFKTASPHNCGKMIQAKLMKREKGEDKVWRMYLTAAGKKKASK